MYVHNYNTSYAANQNLHKFRVKTNTGKQVISFMAIDLWQEIPYKFKDLNQFAFSKSVKSIFSLSNIKCKFPQFHEVSKLCSISAKSNVSFPSTPIFLKFYLHTYIFTLQNYIITPLTLHYSSYMYTLLTSLQY